MKLGYQVVLNGTAYQGIFSESQTVEPTPGVILTLVTQTDKSTGVSRRRLQVTNHTSTPVQVQQAHIRYHLAIPYAHLEYFTSDWGSEYSPVGLDVTYPVRIGTWQGRSSKGCTPFFTTGWKDIFGNQMCILGISVGWSGNWQADIVRLEGENTVTVGLALNNPTGEGLYGDEFSTQVPPGDSFKNIEIFDCYRPDYDTEALSFQFRTYYKNNIRILPPSIASMPVCYNHWWPYEDKFITEDIFAENTKIAAEIGCTNTVLDAGWFGPSEVPNAAGSMPWFQKRGDWDMINTTLFPSGIASLSQRVKVQTSLPFGIWCEIEAVGSEAKLTREHPNLMARRNGKMLDYVCMGNPETVAWALGIFQTLIEKYSARWIKIDFNLDPISCDCQEHGHGKGDGLYAHYQGLYSFMDEVRRRWPEVVLENCSSGGLRIDYGIMQHCHYCFLSDPDFTRHHLQCFWGVTSHIHPSACYHFTQSEIVGDHNVRFENNENGIGVSSPITKETTQTAIDYMTRACMTGVLGFSLKLVELHKTALQRLKYHIDFYLSYAQDFLRNGDMHRLTGQTRSIYGQGEAWNGYQLCASADRHLVFVLKSTGGASQSVIKLKGLNPEKKYTLTSQNTNQSLTLPANSLMKEGFLFTATEPEWSDVLIIQPSK